MRRSLGWSGTATLGCSLALVACGGPAEPVVPGPDPEPAPSAAQPALQPSVATEAPQPPVPREPTLAERAERVVGLLEGGPELSALPTESGWLGSGRARQPWARVVVTIHGKLDQGPRIRSITRRLVRMCVLRGLGGGGTAPGELKLVVEFQADGKALPVRVSGKLEPELQSCLTTQLGRLRSQSFSGPSPEVRAKLSYGLN